MSRESTYLLLMALMVNIISCTPRNKGEVVIRDAQLHNYVRKWEGNSRSPFLLLTLGFKSIAFSSTATSSVIVQRECQSHEWNSIIAEATLGSSDRSDGIQVRYEIKDLSLPSLREALAFILPCDSSKVVIGSDDKVWSTFLDSSEVRLFLDEEEVNPTDSTRMDFTHSKDMPSNIVEILDSLYGY